MPRDSRPDVVILVPLGLEPALRLRTVDCVLDHATPTMGRLIVCGAFAAEHSLLDALEDRRNSDPGIVVLPLDPESTEVEACRDALAVCSGDAVLLSQGAEPPRGWLEELAAVAHAEERTACVSPLDDDLWAEVAAPGELAHPRPASREAIVRSACAGLPRFSPASAVSGVCVYLRQEALEAVGRFDPAFPTRDSALADWVERTQRLGFIATRANHVYVPCPVVGPVPGAAGPAAERAPYPLPVSGRTLDPAPAKDRAPDVPAEPHLPFAPPPDTPVRSLDDRLPGHAVRIEADGKIPVALDIRHIPPEQVGTRTYAVNLAQALAALPEISLTLLVRDPAQARGIKGRVVTADQWLGDLVPLIHKPAQVLDPSELELLFRSEAHVVITYQDLIAHRVPLCFPSAYRHANYCATSRLSLPAAQKIIAYSRSAQAEIAAEFAIPPEEIPVVPLGVEPEIFRERLPLDAVIRTTLRLPRRYFFSVASDYPHKNLPGLLEAYALFKSRWAEGEPPFLVLAGYSSGARTGLYPRLESEAKARGLVFLGPVSPQGLKVLYQNALALVFSSLYEGFGLPPLEAMAAGTPVIAMPFSAVSEVGGDGVLYPDGLSPEALARAMELVARDVTVREALREKGRIRVDELRWANTARNTLDIYRSTILRPSERSLRMRRLLSDAIVHWSGNHSLRLRASGTGIPRSEQPAPLGVRQAYRALKTAVRSRFTREIRRFRRLTARRTA